MPRPLIFDFDGTIADSEPVANQALAECLTALGMTTSYDEAVATYIGLRMSDCIAKAERVHSRMLPADFATTCRARTRALLTESLKPVPGVTAFLHQCTRERTAIASSSSVPGIEFSLALIGLEGFFTGRIFSAADIERGKPHPDIFLKAANGLSADPRDCVAIEDGELGVRAAAAAGMTVIGLIAGSHCRPGHGDHLSAAGAHIIAASYSDVAEIVARLDLNQPRSRNTI